MHRYSHIEVLHQWQNDCYFVEFRDDSQKHEWQAPANQNAQETSEGIEAYRFSSYPW